ncbi:small polypeptide DEVIL 19-like [Curcuma longa]|uniref:small polypeptide DEVIL 19-like n=1 Tax=Curcuma longa TaxID=136217 RepID=UPI003D9E7B8B
MHHSCTKFRSPASFSSFTMADARKKGRRGLSRRCAALVKEQRARIYIMRRCATMLLCWCIHGDD